MFQVPTGADSTATTDTTATAGPAMTDASMQQGLADTIGGYSQSFLETNQQTSSADQMLQTPLADDKSLMTSQTATSALDTSGGLIVTEKGTYLLKSGQSVAGTTAGTSQV